MQQLQRFAGHQEPCIAGVLVRCSRTAAASPGASPSDGSPGASGRLPGARRRRRSGHPQTRRTQSSLAAHRGKCRRGGLGLWDRAGSTARNAQHGSGKCGGAYGACCGQRAGRSRPACCRAPTQQLTAARAALDINVPDAPVAPENVLDLPSSGVVGRARRRGGGWGVDCVGAEACCATVAAVLAPGQTQSDTCVDKLTSLGRTSGGRLVTYTTTGMFLPPPAPPALPAGAPVAAETLRQPACLLAHRAASPCCLRRLCACPCARGQRRSRRAPDPAGFARPALPTTILVRMLSACRRLRCHCSPRSVRRRPPASCTLLTPLHLLLTRPPCPTTPSSTLAHSCPGGRGCAEVQRMPPRQLCASASFCNEKRARHPAVRDPSPAWYRDVRERSSRQITAFQAGIEESHSIS